MKLSEYLKNPITSESDFIYLDKFESLFDSLHNGIDVFFYPKKKRLEISMNEYLAQNHTLLTKAELLNIFNELQDRDTLLLMLNPDVDMPMIKDYYRLKTLDHLPFDHELQSQLETLSIPDFIDQEFVNKIPKGMKIFCHSIIQKTDNLIMIPLGRDPKAKIISSRNFSLKKSETCHYSCTLPPLTLHWYGRIRQYIFDGLSNSSFINSDDTLSKQKISFYLKDNTKYIDYFSTLARTKFVICPRGCGLDTYRVWDSLYLGCVPIVVKFSGYEEFTDLPILWIDDWRNYLELEEEYLSYIWNTMLDTDYNYDKLLFDYWRNKILKNIK